MTITRMCAQHEQNIRKIVAYITWTFIIILIKPLDSCRSRVGLTAQVYHQELRLFLSLCCAPFLKFGYFFQCLVCQVLVNTTALDITAAKSEGKQVERGKTRTPIMFVYSSFLLQGNSSQVLSQPTSSSSLGSQEAA